MTTKRSTSDYIPNESRVGPQCVHCQRPCGTLASGFARFQGQPVCSKPSAPERPDCYRMIMVKFHPVRNCPECMDTTPAEYPVSPRFFGRHGI